MKKNDHCLNEDDFLYFGEQTDDPDRYESLGCFRMIALILLSAISGTANCKLFENSERRKIDYDAGNVTER